MKEHTDNGGGAGDEVMRALDELEAMLRENAESERLLTKRIADLRHARERTASGRPSWAPRTSPARCSW